MSRDIASKIAILAETSTAQKSWSRLAQRLFIIATKDWYEKSLSQVEIDWYLGKAETLTDADIILLFNNNR